MTMRNESEQNLGDTSPGDDGSRPKDLINELINYGIGFALAVILTVASFWVIQTHIVYGPGIPIALVTFAVAQMGIHLVFFLHITTGPDNTNNVLALAFGLLIVGLIIFGSLWIMANLNHNMMPMSDLMKMQR